MKRLFSKTRRRMAGLLLSCLFLSLASCSKEDVGLPDEANTNPTTSQQRTTPVVGGIYVIENLKSGRTLEVDGGSNSNNANVQIWGTNTSSPPTHRQWEVLSVGDGYVRLKCVDSGKSLQTGNQTANGSNINQYAYAGQDWQEWEIISLGSDLFSVQNRHSGKYLRASGLSDGTNVHLWQWKNWQSQKWYFNQVGGSGGGGSSGGGTAASIIGSGWKLNGYSGSLSVGSNDNGLDYEDDASTSDSHFFFEKDGYAAFRTYAGNPTSGTSSNPRTELREQIGGGDGYWNGNTSTEHSMKWRFIIEDLPPSGKLAFGQIHEKDDFYDDVIRVQVQGSAGQNSGSVTLRILGYVTEEIDGEGKTINFSMSLDTEYYFELTMQNGVVKLYNLNTSGSRTQTLYTSVDIGNANENYFKAGCYLQSTSSSHSSSSDYGQVLIKDLTVSPDN